MATGQAESAEGIPVVTRKLTVRESYGEAAHELQNPNALGPRSRYEVETYAAYPRKPARRETAFLREDIYPEPEPEFLVDVPREFGDLHHRAPNYHRVRISEAVHEGSPIEPRRRSGWLTLGMSGVLTLSIITWATSCNEAVKQKIDEFMALQSNYQTMPTHVPEPAGVASNPPIAPYPMPSLATDMPLQVDPPKPKPTVRATVIAASPAKPKQLKCINEWAQERKVGQLIILPLDKYGAYALAPKDTDTSPDKAKETTKRVMRELHIGGILLTEGTPAEKAAIIKEYSAKGEFEAPLLIGDVDKDDWYGFNKSTLITSADMGAPALPGDKQLTIPQRFVLELKAKTNAPVFLSDTANRKDPLSVYDQAFAMRSAGVDAVLGARIDANVLAREVAENFMARGDKGADPCAVKISK